MEKIRIFQKGFNYSQDGQGNRLVYHLQGCKMCIRDRSSTAAYVARELKGKKEGLTIITNSVEIILELFDVPEWNVISTGGVSREKSFALVLSLIHISCQMLRRHTDTFRRTDRKIL